MKLWGIFRFELAYQVRRPWPWLIFAALLLFSVLFTRDGSLSEVQYTDFFINSPFLLACAAVFGSVVWLLAAAAIAGEAAARDVATGMHPLVYTAPIRRSDYLGGRFLAALVMNAGILLAVPLGNLLGVYGPGVHPDAVGPLRPAAYLTAYAFIAVPNAFAATALQFSLALRSGRPMAGYLGSLLLFFMGFFVASFLLFRRGLGTLLDPIGIRFVIEDIAHLWTTVEKNQRLLGLDGVVLRNRLLWTAVGLATLAATYVRFGFVHRAEPAGWMRRLVRRAGAARPEARAPVAGRAAGAGRRPVAIPVPRRTFGPAIQARQTLAIGVDSFRAIAKSWAGLALLAGIPLLAVPVLADQMLSSGVPLTPTTGQVLKELTAPLSEELSRWVIVPLLTVFFAGELVWREREAGLSEISDATSVPGWVPLLGKLLGLGLVLAAFTAAQMAAGMLAQTMMGHRDFEIGLYLAVLFGLQLPEYLLFAVLALSAHAVIDQKYVGHLVAVVAYVVILLSSMFGIEHGLLVYGAGPGWTYTEMRGLGPFLEPWLWFKLYWAAWALLLLVAARLFWSRGREGGPGARVRLARQRLTGATAATGAAAAGLVLGLGGFVFYNTNVLNEYLGSSEVLERRAAYEKRYGRHARAPQPRLTATRLHVEIHPDRRAAEIRGSHRLVNRSGVPIDTIHVAVAHGAATSALAFDRPAAAVLRDEDLGLRIYALETPLQPGDSLRLDFRVRYQARGFREGGADLAVVENGTLFTHAWLPAVGYQRGRELIHAADRRKHGLSPRPVIPSLHDTAAREERGEGISFEAVVGTRADQVAVAPGALRRTWTQGGRRYFHYATDAPIGGELVFTSARYAVHEARWTGPAAGPGDDVAIRIVHHPGHRGHLEPMVRSIRASLDYYTARIGPYRHRHITVAEVPGDGVGVHADASMLTHGEGVTLLRPRERGLDLPFAIMAHEMAHQWAVPAAAVEGAPVLSESLAWYYAMGVVEHALGPEQLRRLLAFMRQPHPYAPIRRGEPLLRGLDPYMSYRKGPLALRALDEYLGAGRVNAALRRLWEAHLPSGEPPATTLDLYRELQAVTPDSLRYLLHDLFEVNTFRDLRTERASAEQVPGGAWRVRLEVEARKVVVDSAGVERRMPMDEWVPVGVFARAEPGGGGLSAPLYLGMHRIRSGQQVVTLTVPRRPALAGIDPHHVLDWEELEDDDNLQEVTVAP